MALEGCLLSSSVLASFARRSSCGSIALSSVVRRSSRLCSHRLTIAAHSLCTSHTPSRATLLRIAPGAAPIGGAAGLPAWRRAGGCELLLWAPSNTTTAFGTCSILPRPIRQRRICPPACCSATIECNRPTTADGAAPVLRFPRRGRITRRFPNRTGALCCWQWLRQPATSPGPAPYQTALDSFGRSVAGHPAGGTPRTAAQSVDACSDL
jgi:hypothetical protein